MNIHVITGLILFLISYLNGAPVTNEYFDKIKETILGSEVCGSRPKFLSLFESSTSTVNEAIDSPGLTLGCSKIENEIQGIICSNLLKQLNSVCGNKSYENLVDDAVSAVKAGKRPFVSAVEDLIMKTAMQATNTDLETSICDAESPLRTACILLWQFNQEKTSTSLPSSDSKETVGFGVPENSAPNGGPPDGSSVTESHQVENNNAQNTNNNEKGPAHTPEAENSGAETVNGENSGDEYREDKQKSNPLSPVGETTISENNIPNVFNMSSLLTSSLCSKDRMLSFYRDSDEENMSAFNLACKYTKDQAELQVCSTTVNCLQKFCNDKTYERVEDEIVSSQDQDVSQALPVNDKEDQEKEMCDWVMYTIADENQRPSCSVCGIEHPKMRKLCYMVWYLNFYMYAVEKDQNKNTNADASPHVEENGATVKENKHTTLEENKVTSFKENKDLALGETKEPTLGGNKDTTLSKNKDTTPSENKDTAFGENTDSTLEENKNTAHEENKDPTLGEDKVNDKENAPISGNENGNDVNDGSAFVQEEDSQLGNTDEHKVEAEDDGKTNDENTNEYEGNDSSVGFPNNENGLDTGSSEDLSQVNEPEKANTKYGEKDDNINQNVHVQYKNRNFEDEESSSHFLAYSLTAIILILASYIAYHNKNKIIAVIIEGRTGKGNGRRGGSYRRLNQNVSSS